MHSALSEGLFEQQTSKIAGSILEVRKWRVMVRAFPYFEVMFTEEARRAIRVRMACDNWNDAPPSIAILAEDGAPLVALPTGSGIFNSSAHPATHAPFICMAGVREFHNHPSHTGDSWENYRTRSSYDLGGILTQIWHGWLKSTP